MFDGRQRQQERRAHPAEAERARKLNLDELTWRVMEAEAEIAGEVQVQESLAWQGKRYAFLRSEMARDTEGDGMAWSWGPKGWKRGSV